MIEAAAGPSPSEPRHRLASTVTTSVENRRVWAAETQEGITKGRAIFPDATTLGRTIGVSCALCHPDAAHTHLESSPTDQIQRQRVIGVPFDESDRRLRALEASSLLQSASVTRHLAMALGAAVARVLWSTQHRDSASILSAPLWGSRTAPRGGSARPHGALPADTTMPGVPAVPWLVWRLALAW